MLSTYLFAKSTTFRRLFVMSGWHSLCAVLNSLYSLRLEVSKVWPNTNCVSRKAKVRQAQILRFPLVQTGFLVLCVLGIEDKLRFYGLRLHVAGMIKSSPKKIIPKGGIGDFSGS
jgi:hypothetical protein